jgi:hypothetical protein
MNLKKMDRGEMTTGLVADIGKRLRGPDELPPAVREEYGSVLIGAAEVLATRVPVQKIMIIADEAEKALSSEYADRQQILEDLITALRKLS